MVISVHIPKCAGTSFRHVLASHYGSRLWLNYGTVFSRTDYRPEAVPDTTACIHGHFFADAFDDAPRQARYITWVRHPVDRVVSNYHHFLRSPDMRDDCCRQLHEQRLTLRDFAELDWMRDEATRYLAGKPLAAFAFVGIAERFEDSLGIFANRFGWPTPDAAPRVNTNPERPPAGYALPEADYAHILALNARDFAWYQAALTRLDLELYGRGERSA